MICEASPRCPEGPVPWDGRAEGLLCLLPVPCRVVASPKGACPVWWTDGKEEPGEGRRLLQGWGIVLVHLGTLKLLVLSLGM